MADAASVSNGMTMLKGLGIAIGGFALGFFSCVGGINVDSMALIVAGIILGIVAIIIGGRLMIKGFVRVLMGFVKPAPKDP
jgi:hypothetical protein